jgi:FMN phosphatase YigB (HAD superfamily)
MVHPNDAVMFDIDDTLITSKTGKRIEEVYNYHRDSATSFRFEREVDREAIEGT